MKFTLLLTGHGAARTRRITAPLPRASAAVVSAVREAAGAQGLPPGLFREPVWRRGSARSAILCVFVRRHGYPSRNGQDRRAGELGFTRTRVHPEPAGSNDPVCALGRADGIAVTRLLLLCRESYVRRFHLSGPVPCPTTGVQLLGSV